MNSLLLPGLGLLVCLQSCISAFILKSSSVSHDAVSYEYVPALLQWSGAADACHQRSGSLAAVASEEDKQTLSGFLNSLNISGPVWIDRKVMTYVTSSPDTLVLRFDGPSDRKHARILHNFPSMSSVTVCVRLRFDPNSLGTATIFSYSTRSNVNGFQLRAKVVRGKPVQLALMVHGVHGPYLDTFSHDDFWHRLCVSWSRNGGNWLLYTQDTGFSRGEGLSGLDDIDAGGLFIIGQEQDVMGGAFKRDESFPGSVTELHVWDRVLNTSEILAMETECSPVSAGLMFKWGGAALEIEASLAKQWIHEPCQDLIPS